MIRFRVNTPVTIIEGFDEKTDNITDEHETTFKQGEQVDADIFNEDEHYADIQYGDGSISLGVLKDCFEIM